MLSDQRKRKINQALCMNPVGAPEDFGSDAIFGAMPLLTLEIACLADCDGLDHSPSLDSARVFIA